MTKKQLFEMLSDVPEDAVIAITYESSYLIGNTTHVTNIKGYYEYQGTYILSAANVRPNIIESND